MRILALVSDAFGGHGGIALYNRNVLTALCEHHSRPDVIALPRLAPHALEAMPRNLDFRVTVKENKLKFTVEALKVMVSGPPIDLVVCSHIRLLPIATLVRRYCRSKLVLFVYGMDAWTEGNRLTARMVCSVDACIGIRAYTLAELRRWTSLPASRCHVLHNAIDPTPYQRADRRIELARKYGLEGRKVLMTLGRVAHDGLGFDEVVDVLPELVAECPELVYLVVGGGEYLSTLKLRVAAARMDNHVVFTDLINQDEKPDHYKLADAFAMAGTHPTGWDDYPLRFVFLEALASGLPVVASRPRDYESDPGLSDAPLIYVNPCDREDLKRGLRQALASSAGSVPPNMHRYFYPAFRARLHGIVDAVV